MIDKDFELSTENAYILAVFEKYLKELLNKKPCVSTIGIRGDGSQNITKT